MVRISSPRLVWLLSVFVSGACAPDGAEIDRLFLSSSAWIDLSYAFDAETIYWPTAEAFRLETVADGITEGGYYYAAYSFAAAEHGGTHLDAPVHFAEGRSAVAEIPLARLIGPAVVVDVSDKASADSDYLVSVADFEAFEAAHGPLEDGIILLLRTGWGRHWPDAEAYLGTATLGPDAVPLLHFPGLAPEAARWLVENRNIAAIGIDTPSIDFGQSSTFETHQILYGDNIPGFENVANLEAMPEVGAYVIALPMKIGGGSGAPLRIVGVVPGS
ncbi:MAG: cyclase family protein [Dehalococcoidia bacterium]